MTLTPMFKLLLLHLPLPVLLRLHLLLKHHRRTRVTPGHLQQRVLWPLHRPLVLACPLAASDRRQVALRWRHCGHGLPMTSAESVPRWRWYVGEAADVRIAGTCARGCPA